MRMQENSGAVAAFAALNEQLGRRPLHAERRDPLKLTSLPLRELLEKHDFDAHGVSHRGEQFVVPTMPHVVYTDPAKLPAKPLHFQNPMGGGATNNGASCTSASENGLSIEKLSHVLPYTLEGFLFACGGGCLARILLPMIMHGMERTSGFPDLTVWGNACGGAKSLRTSENSAHDDPAPLRTAVLFSEVKSDNDVLSDRQRTWLNYMISATIPCELCHVTRV